MIQSNLNQITDGGISVTVPAPQPQPELIISQDVQDIMDDLDNGEAFDKTILNNITAANNEWSILAASDEAIFGSFSPIKGMLRQLTDPTPMDLADVEALGLRDDNDQLIPLDQLTSLVDRPRGGLVAMQQQIANQFLDFSDNITLYASHQRAMNAMGRETGCNALSKHFGTIAQFGQEVSLAVTEAQAAIFQFQQLKNQIQFEIDTFDDNVINILTGRVSGTITSELIRGTGLFDQLDNILISAGLADDSIEAQQIRAEVGALLDPTLRGFFNQKSITNEEIRRINRQQGGIFGQISQELRQVDVALNTLRRLGAANSLSGLFQANECVQTLMGFVATTPFLNKLGRSSL